MMTAKKEITGINKKEILVKTKIVKKAKSVITKAMVA